MIEHISAIDAILFYFGASLFTLGLLCCLVPRLFKLGVFALLIADIPLFLAIAFPRRLLDLAVKNGINLQNLPTIDQSLVLGISAGVLSWAFILTLYLYLFKSKPASADDEQIFETDRQTLPNNPTLDGQIESQDPNVSGAHATAFGVDSSDRADRKANLKTKKNSKSNKNNQNNSSLNNTLDEEEWNDSFENPREPTLSSDLFMSNNYEQNASNSNVNNAINTSERSNDPLKQPRDNSKDAKASADHGGQIDLEHVSRIIQLARAYGDPHNEAKANLVKASLDQSQTNAENSSDKSGDLALKQPNAQPNYAQNYNNDLNLQEPNQGTDYQNSYYDSKAKLYQNVQSQEQNRPNNALEQVNNNTLAGQKVSDMLQAFEQEDQGKAFALNLNQGRKVENTTKSSLSSFADILDSAQQRQSSLEQEQNLDYDHYELENKPKVRADHDDFTGKTVGQALLNAQTTEQKPQEKDNYDLAQSKADIADKADNYSFDYKNSSLHDLSLDQNNNLDVALGQDSLVNMALLQKSNYQHPTEAKSSAVSAYQEPKSNLDFNEHSESLNQEQLNQDHNAFSSKSDSSLEQAMQFNKESANANGSYSGSVENIGAPGGKLFLNSNDPDVLELESLRQEHRYLQALQARIQNQLSHIKQSEQSLEAEQEQTKNDKLALKINDLAKADSLKGDEIDSFSFQAKHALEALDQESPKQLYEAPTLSVAVEDNMSDKIKTFASVLSGVDSDKDDHSNQVLDHDLDTLNRQGLTVAEALAKLTADISSTEEVLRNGSHQEVKVVINEQLQKLKGAEQQDKINLKAQLEPKTQPKVEPKIEVKPEPTATKATNFSDKEESAVPAKGQNANEQIKSEYRVENTLDHADSSNAVDPLAKTKLNQTKAVAQKAPESKSTKAQVSEQVAHKDNTQLMKLKELAEQVKAQNKLSHVPTKPVTNLSAKNNLEQASDLRASKVLPKQTQNNVARANVSNASSVKDGADLTKSKRAPVKANVTNHELASKQEPKVQSSNTSATPKVQSTVAKAQVKAQSTNANATAKAQSTMSKAQSVAHVNSKEPITANKTPSAMSKAQSPAHANSKEQQANAKVQSSMSKAQNIAQTNHKEQAKIEPKTKTILTQESKDKVSQPKFSSSQAAILSTNEAKQAVSNMLSRLNQNASKLLNEPKVQNNQIVKTEPKAKAVTAKVQAPVNKELRDNSASSQLKAKASQVALEKYLKANQSLEQTKANTAEHPIVSYKSQEQKQSELIDNVAKHNVLNPSIVNTKEPTMLEPKSLTLDSADPSVKRRSLKRSMIPKQNTEESIAKGVDHHQINVNATKVEVVRPKSLKRFKR